MRIKLWNLKTKDFFFIYFLLECHIVQIIHLASGLIIVVVVVAAAAAAAVVYDDDDDDIRSFFFKFEAQDKMGEWYNTQWSLGRQWEADDKGSLVK